MSDPIVLKQEAENGDRLEAAFLPDQGMNLVSFKRGETEVMDQTVQHPQGPGVFIGPHFGHRHPSFVGGKVDPFAFGVGRYAPWTVEANESKVKAMLSGKESWQGKPLSDLEGQNFTMSYIAELRPTGLEIELSIVSDTDSLVGVQLCYALPEGKGIIRSDVKKEYYQDGLLQPLPEKWKYDGQGMLNLDLAENYNCSFRPFLHPLKADVRLETSQYALSVRYFCVSEEISWQLYRPAGEQYVCINPTSSQNPWKPNLSVSSIRIELEIL